MFRTSLILPAGLLLSLLGGAEPRAQAPAARADQPYVSSATAILVDVVVRDRKGRPVTDLSATDFEIAEDGVAQRVATFTRVSRGGGIGVNVAWRSPATTITTSPRPASPEAPVPAPPPEEATVALVFDRLSPENLRLAQRATLAYVPMNGEASTRVGVFASEAGMRVLQPYTVDVARIRKAVARVVPGGATAAEEKAERGDELVARRHELRGDNAAAIGSMQTGGAGMARTAAEVGQREAELRMVQTELNMIRSFDNMDREHRGYDTSLALLSVVRSLSAYPGRKTIVFFSEGLPVSPSLSARLDHVIEAANRANVTAYAVDAHGLRARSALTNLYKEVDEFASERLTQLATGGDRTEGPLTMAFERVEDTLKLDSRTGLARLAGETGGFLIEGSNDLGAAFRRIDEDTQFHYLLTYSPTNTAFDGKYREIRVQVRRPGAQVFARKGYRAVRTPASLAAGGLEVPASALLGRRPVPNAFPVHAAGFTFPHPQRRGLTPLLVQVPTSMLRYDVPAGGASYSAQAAILLRIRDARGDQVLKLSQEYLLTGDAKDVDAAKRGEILFYREADLPPGVYTMETAVLDPLAEAGSVRVATLTVPDTSALPFAMSSIVLVDRVEEVADVPAGAGTNGPLHVGRSLVYPNLGEPIRRSATRELPFYFTLYGATAGLDAAAQLLRNGQVIAQTALPLPAGNGPSVQHVGRLPVGALPPGTYELRIVARSGGRELAQTAFFTLRD